MNKKLKKHIKGFLGFLIFGVLLGFIENLIVIDLGTELSITIDVIFVSLGVVIPFAIIGELIIDKVTFFPKTKNKNLHHLEIFLEFLIFGIVMGVIEDLIVIWILTGGTITLNTVIIVILVTIPFAILSELIVDRKDWFKWINTKSKKAFHLN